MKFSIKDFFSKCDQIHRKLRIWSHLLKKSFMENFIFCAVYQDGQRYHMLSVLGSPKGLRLNIFKNLFKADLKKCFDQFLCCEYAGEIFEERVVQFS